MHGPIADGADLVVEVREVRRRWMLLHLVDLALGQAPTSVAQAFEVQVIDHAGQVRWTRRCHSKYAAETVQRAIVRAADKLDRNEIELAHHSGWEDVVSSLRRGDS